MVNLQLQSFQVEDIKQDYETGKDNVTMVTFKVDFDKAESLEEALKANCSRDIVFYRRWTLLPPEQSPYGNTKFFLSHT